MKRTFAIVGSRTYPTDKDAYETLSDEEKALSDAKGLEFVADFMRHLKGNVTIVSGGAKGPDTWAADIARSMGFKVVEILPNWTKYGKGAGFKRNTEIVRAADDVVAFWDMFSNGTYDTIKKATEFRKDLLVFGPDGQPLMVFEQKDYDRDKGFILPKMDIPKNA